MSTQMETSKSFTGHILPPNFDYVMDIASMLTLKMMPSHTNCLRMGFHWEAQKSLQARSGLPCWFCQGQPLLCPNHSALVPRLEGKRPFCPAPTLPSWVTGRGGRIQLLPGQAVPPAHAEPHPDTCTWALHHCHFSHHPWLRQGLGGRGATSASTRPGEQQAG